MRLIDYINEKILDSTNQTTNKYSKPEISNQNNPNIILLIYNIKLEINRLYKWKNINNKYFFKTEISKPEQSSLYIFEYIV